MSFCQQTERHAEKTYQRTSAGFMVKPPAVSGNSHIITDYIWFVNREILFFYRFLEKRGE
jgi:hypothetical protein